MGHKPADSLPLPDRNLQAPIYLQLYRRYKDAISAGRLKPGDRVPAIRSLASELNLSRGTVEAAYQMLIGEGYLEAHGPAGTVVSPRLSQVSGLASPPEEAAVPCRVRERYRDMSTRPFQLGLPALDAFPTKLWRRLMTHRLRDIDTTALGYPDPAGYRPLRERIASYLGISRGIQCSPEQVFITAGYQGALELICHCLMRPGEQVWFEDPGYHYAGRQLAGSGAQLVPIPVDEQGLNVEFGRQHAPDAGFAVITPSHQSPLGVALALPRRLELLQWANQADSWIIEDDYDSEYRYEGHPLPALKSLDQQGRVLYIGTFSKVLFPGLRLGYLVVPASEVERFQDACHTFFGGCFTLAQATVSDFMSEGHFARHLKKMRSLYAQRRAYMAQALRDAFGERLHIRLQAGGMHLLAELVDGDDIELAAKAQADGLAVHALSHWCLETQCRPSLLLGFTNVTSEDEAKHLAERLRTSLNC